MNNKEYEYRELADQVYKDINSAITESGQKAVSDGIKKIVSNKIDPKALKNLKLNTKEFTKYIEDALQDAANNKPLKIKSQITIDPQITNLNERDLNYEIQELYEKASNASGAAMERKYNKQFTHAVTLGQLKGFNIDADMSGYLKDLLDPYYNESAKELQNIFNKTIENFIRQNVFDSIYEYTNHEIPQIISETKQPVPKINKNDLKQQGAEAAREVKKGYDEEMAKESKPKRTDAEREAEKQRILREIYGIKEEQPAKETVQEQQKQLEQTKEINAELNKQKEIADEINKEYKENNQSLIQQELRENIEKTNKALEEQHSAISNETPVLPKESIKETQEQIQETNVELEKQEELIEEITQKRKEADKVSGKFLHITDKDFDKFDLSKSKGGQLGSGAYFIDEDEHLPDTFPGKYIKEVEINLEKCFILTKNYISSLSDLNEILDTSIPEGTDSRQIANEIRKYTTNHAKEFAEQMLAKGYQGLYTSDYLTMRKGNTDRKNELVVYDETKLDKIKSFTKNGFQELKNVEEIPQQIEKANESLDEFQQKLKGIKEFSEEYDLFDFKDFDEETLDKLQNTLFSLTSEDLKKLGFENTDEILEDLATINERLAEVRWQFENNDFTDEGWVQSDQLDDYVDTGLSRVSIFHDIDEIADEARISVSRLINTIVDFDDNQSVGQIVDVEPEKLKQVEKATELVNQQTKTVKELQQQEEDEIETRINLLDVLKEVNQETVSQPETSMPEVAQEEKKVITEEKELQKQTKQTTQAIEEQTAATDRAFNSFGELRRRVDELKEEQARLEKENSNLTDVYKRYQRKQNEYSLLSDKELEAKWQEKLEHKTDYKSLPGSDDFYKKWSSVLALVDEIQKRTGETKDLNLLSTSGIMNEVDIFAEKIRDYAENVDKYDQITNKILVISREWKQLEDSASSYNSPLDKVEKQLYENIDYIIGAKRIRTERKDAVLSELSQIERIKGSSVSIEDYTKEEKVIAAINERFEELQKRRKELAETKPVFINDEERKAFAKQEAEKLAAQRGDKKNADATVEAQREIQAALKETAQVQEQVGQQQQSSANDNINSYRNLIKTMKEFVDAVASQRQTSQQTNTEEVTQSNKDLANASENTANALSLESQAAIDTENSLSKLTTAKQINAEQEEKLAQKTQETTKALNNENNVAKETAKSLKTLSEVKSQIKPSKNKKQINKIDNIVPLNTDQQNNQTSKIDKITEAYKNLAKTQKEFAILENKKQNGESLTNKEAGRYQELIVIRDKYNDVIQEQTAYTVKQMKAYEKYNQVVKETAAYIQGLSENDTFSSDAQKRINKLFGTSNRSEDFYNQVKDIQYLLDNIVTPEAQSDLDSYKQTIEKLLSDLETNGNDFKLITDLQKAKLDNQMADWLEKNTKASVETRNAVKQLRIELNEIDDVNSLKKITSEFIKLKSATSDAQKTGASFFDKVLGRIKDVNVKFLAQYFSLHDWIRYIRQIASTVTELDTAITELRKVSDASDERLALSFERSAETAKQLGDSITNVINVTADWSRLGYSVDDAEELARVTTLFKNVGDNMSADDASSYMISTLQGFQMTAEESESIVDKFNEVANNYAIDTRGIGEALQRSAASFNAANTSLSGAIAVVTTANSVVQNPEQVGTAMKTLSARIRGSKAELEELGEEEENVVELTSKLRNEVKAMTGFDIMQDENTYKSIDEIIIGIGEHWQELTDIQQAALAEDLAGKRNSNVLIALLQNAEQVKKVYETAEDAAGSAQREQENYMKSIQYSLDRFKAIWQDIQSDLFGSDSVKSIIESAATGLEGLGKTAETIAPLISILTNALGALFKALGAISEATGGLVPILGTIGIGAGIYNKKKKETSGRDKKPSLITAGRYNSLSWDTSLNIA